MKNFIYYDPEKVSRNYKSAWKVTEENFISNLFNQQLDREKYIRELKSMGRPYTTIMAKAKNQVMVDLTTGNYILKRHRSTVVLTKLDFAEAARELKTIVSKNLTNSCILYEFDSGKNIDDTVASSGFSRKFVVQVLTANLRIMKVKNTYFRITVHGQV